jgi:hypothetical protein
MSLFRYPGMGLEDNSSLIHQGINHEQRSPYPRHARFREPFGAQGKPSRQDLDNLGTKVGCWCLEVKVRAAHPAKRAEWPLRQRERVQPKCVGAVTFAKYVARILWTAIRLSRYMSTLGAVARG